MTYARGGALDNNAAGTADPASRPTKGDAMSFIPVVKAGKGGITHPDLTASWGKGAVLSINAEVSHYQPGGQDPHFSVTGEVRTDESRRLRDIQGGGCLHDEALRYWPEVAPIVALHGSSAKTGEPMHGSANGWYFLSGYFDGAGERYHYGNSKGHHRGEYRLPTPRECLETFAGHVRVSIEEAEQVAGRVAAIERGKCPVCDGSALANGLPCSDCKGTGAESDRRAYVRAWAAECEAMRPRWQRECLEGLAWLLQHGTPSDLRAEWFKRVPEYTGHAIQSLPLPASVQP